MHNHVCNTVCPDSLVTYDMEVHMHLRLVPVGCLYLNLDHATLALSLDDQLISLGNECQIGYGGNGQCVQDWILVADFWGTLILGLSLIG
jgi:hypothetical protein